MEDPTEIGDQVKFRAASVFLWPDEEPVAAVPHDTEIEGRITGFSDSGSQPRVFAVVEVVRTQKLVVRVSGLEVTKRRT